ncbi:uncharacterized protein IL334_001256 [Kwoniella shivajii]|uniref:Uncharacterized protein n=1 Tax=Kwoniella shivajii TaxID=564305 RepID=A0ABZ1CT14_9TREE|nr:hypothetical protein IL334_001256 [Kwoniella shivajii]
MFSLKTIVVLLALTATGASATSSSASIAKSSTTLAKSSTSASKSSTSVAKSSTSAGSKSSISAGKGTTTPVAKSSASAAPTAYHAVKFTNSFPSVFHTGQTVNLTWTGGDGYYAVYRLQVTQGQGSVRPGYYTHNTTQTSLSVTLDENISPKTTLNFGISEANILPTSQLALNETYQLSGAIPFIQA